MTLEERMISLLQQGYGCQQQGHLQQACEKYNEVLRLDGNNVHALNLLGLMALNSGAPEQAIELILRALSSEPGDAQAHANIALAYKDTGQLERSMKHLQTAVTLAPDNPVYHNNLGNILRDLDSTKEAIICFENALQRDQQNAQYWSNLASAFSDAGQYQHAVVAAERAVEIDSELPQPYRVRGDVMRQLGRFADACVCYEKAIGLAPDFTEAMISLSDTQRDMDQPEKAINTVQVVLQISPRNPFAHHALGVLHEQLGDRESAARCFSKSIDCAPAYVSAYYQLAQLKGRQPLEEEIVAMQALWDERGLLPSDRKLLAFALFRAFDARNETEQAWPFLEKGNQMKAQDAPYDDPSAATLMQKAALGAEQLRAKIQLKLPYAERPRPVFVLGMPRSGTTLTEQILSAHSAVHGAGEVSYAFDCARMASSLTGSPFPECVAQLSAGQLQEVGDYYRSRFSSIPAAASCIVDKTPLNFQYIGLLAQALPEARFIHCHRDPVDNCFSIYRIPFDEKQTYAHGQQSLAQYYGHYRNLMTQWQKMFTRRILDVQYEATVDDIEVQSRRMLTFLDLEFEEAVLDFYNSRRLVKTPSASQVREPVYRDSLQSWRRYEDQLGPLVVSLDAALK